MSENGNVATCVDSIVIMVRLLRFDFTEEEEKEEEPRGTNARTHTHVDQHSLRSFT